jgi:hypothetical protein
MRVKDASKKSQVKVPGRGLLMSGSTQRIPHKHIDRKRPKTRELIRDLG